MIKQDHSQHSEWHMEPKKLNISHNETVKKTTIPTAQTKTQKGFTSRYNTVVIVHGKFSNLVSSETVYSIRHIPKKKPATGLHQ